jgi:putative transposase
MKGRYSGRYMTIYGYVMPGAASIAHLASRTMGLSKKAKDRLKTLDWHRFHGKNISLTCRHFGIQRRIFREWIKRYKLLGAIGLNDRSRRPKKVRQPTTTREFESNVIAIRNERPYWGKNKIHSRIRKERGIVPSPSTVGRILKRRGLINKKISAKRSKAALSPKKRYPRDLMIKEAGDMVQVDTKYVIGIGGKKMYQWTAIDVLTKQRVLWASTRLSSRKGKGFLRIYEREFGFVIKAVQTDNGKEFLKEFDFYLKQKSIPHYFIEPHSPKQNCYVERSHRTDDDEFYSQGNTFIGIKTFLPRLKKWQDEYNTIRPHQSLNYLTPEEYFQKCNAQKIQTKDIIHLQT